MEPDQAVGEAQGVDPIVDVTSCANAVVAQATEDSYAYHVEGLIILERAGSCRASATTRCGLPCRIAQDFTPPSIATTPPKAAGLTAPVMFSRGAETDHCGVLAVSLRSQPIWVRACVGSGECGP